MLVVPQRFMVSIAWAYRWGTEPWKSPRLSGNGDTEYWPLYGYFGVTVFRLLQAVSIQLIFWLRTSIEKRPEMCWWFREADLRWQVGLVSNNLGYVQMVYEVWSSKTLAFQADFDKIHWRMDLWDFWWICVFFEVFHFCWNFLKLETGTLSPWKLLDMIIWKWFWKPHRLLRYPDIQGHRVTESSR